MTRRILDARTADELGALDADAVARVREQAWPRAARTPKRSTRRSCWMGYVSGGRGRAAGRAGSTGSPRPAASCATAIAIFAVEATRDPKRGARVAGWRRSGRCSWRPGSDDEALLAAARVRGLRCCARASTGAQAWCDRRLLARIHRYTLDRLRRGDRAGHRDASSSRFLACWQHVDPEHRLRRPRGRRRGRASSSRASRSRPRPGRAASLPVRVRGYRASGSTSSR